MRFPVRTAFVTPVAPPHDSGQGIVLGRLLEGFAPDSYVLVTSMLASEETAGLPVPAGARLRVRREPARLNPWLALALRTLRIAWALRRSGARAVVGCSGRLLELPAAWLAARLLRLPFHAWLMDDWLLQSLLDPNHRVADVLEPRIVRSARTVFVPNPGLGEELRRRHPGLPVVCVPNPWYDGPPSAVADAHRLVYTGQIYSAQLDAVLNTLQALDLLDRPGLRLDVFSGWTTPGALAGPRVALHPHQPFAKAARIHAEAEVLLLPLAFRSPYPELIRTSCPTKLSDYLRSGRPILVHAPADSFLVRFCREHECALVVDRPDPTALAQALGRLLDDPVLAARLGTRAREVSALFAPDRSRRALLEALSR